MACSRRNFSGRTYYYYEVYARKSDANRIAEYLRDKGYGARITGSYKTGYTVWSTKK